MRSFLYSFDFAIRGLLRRKTKNVSIALLFTLIVFLFSGIDFMSSSLYQSTLQALEYQPSIIVQRINAGRQVPISLDRLDKISAILGVAEVRGRVWGYYFDPYTGANYTIMGVPDGLPESWDLTISGDARADAAPLSHGEAVVGKGVLTARDLTVGEELYFTDSNDKPVVFEVRSAFTSPVSLWNHDMILVTEADARRLFGIESGKAWDLAVDVPNDFEVPKVGEKILALMPGARVIATNQLKRTYGSSFGFRSGILLVSSLTCLMAFLILAYDRVAGLSQEEQKEIAILKAVGWQTSDVIRLNMLQGLILSLTGFLLGIVLSYYHVFGTTAPLLRIAFSGWSVLYPPHPLPPFLDLSKVFGLMFLTVVPYIAVGIVPVWRASIKDPEEVFRS